MKIIRTLELSISDELTDEEIDEIICKAHITGSGCSEDIQLDNGREINVTVIKDNSKIKA